MNILPAIEKQKILLITGAIVLLILIGGAAYVAQTSDTETAFRFPGTTQKQETLPIQLLAEQTSESSTTYTLRYAADKAHVINGMSIRLVAFTDTLEEQSTTFSVNETLREYGWQALLSTNSVERAVDATTFTYELALLRISTKEATLEPNTILGTFTLSGSTEPVEFQIDSTASTAILADNSELTLELVP